MSFDGVWFNQSTGVLIPAADFDACNADVNLIYNDYRTLWWMPVGTASNLGNHFATSLANAGVQRLNIIIPDNYNSGGTTTAEWLVSDATGGTLTYAIDADYFNAAAAENYNFHTGSSSGLTVSLTSNKPKLISTMAVLGSLAAGDFVGLKFTSTSSPSGALKILGFRLKYQRTL